MSPLAQAFFPPELAVQSEMQDVGTMGLGGKTDLLRRLYFRRLHQMTHSPELDRELVAAVIDHARRVIAHPSRPMITRRESFLRHPFAEIALEDTIEEAPLLDQPEDFLVEYQEEKPFSCVAILDCSSSMSGEKHLLASIAVAVLLLEVPPRDTSLSVFASDAITIKPLLAPEAPETTILKFLRTQPKGFTNIHRGLSEGLKQLRGAGTARRKVGILASDGRTTEGGDPNEVAREFDFLVVLHLHGPGSHLDASKEMAQAGNGICLEVESFEALPRRLYDAIRLIARM